MTIFNNGYFAPMFDMHLRHHSVATVDDILTVKITFRPSRGAKLVFDYEIRRESDSALVLTASTVQLFTTREGEFEPSCPPFYENWKREHGVEI